MSFRQLKTKRKYSNKLLLTIFSLLTFIIQAKQNTEFAVKDVANTKGLIAFWDFKKSDENTWNSYFDPIVIEQSFPVFLRQINDPQRYSVSDWPFKENNAAIVYDTTGPFGQAVRFNRGYVYGEVPREIFEKTSLNIHNKQSFTMITWVKFIDKRHFVAGIWDEGGWDKYAGQRQVALFSGLFNQKGVIAHISATGAASYPQSSINGAQYARLRAIDGQPFEDNVWVAMAMTYQSENNEVRAYLNGEMTALALADPVTEDVYGKQKVIKANPFNFEQAIYSPRTFQLKFNGYDFHNDRIKEHSLWVDLNLNKVKYQHIIDRTTDNVSTSNNRPEFRMTFNLVRQGKSLLAEPLVHGVNDDKVFKFLPSSAIQNGDVVIAKLLRKRRKNWQQVGSTLKHTVIEGAPFTFGRALGLGSEDLSSGSELYIDGVAVFNRVLSEKELSALSFNE